MELRRLSSSMESDEPEDRHESVVESKAGRRAIECDPNRRASGEASKLLTEDVPPSKGCRGRLTKLGDRAAKLENGLETLPAAVP